MEASFISRILAEDFVRIICQTLVHSLWIGVVVAGVAGATMLKTGKRPPLLRYRLLCGCLVLFVLMITGAFYYELAGRQVSTASPNLLLLNKNAFGISRVTGDAHIRSLEYKMPFNGWVDQYSPWIFTIWFAFFAVKSLLLLRGLSHVYTVRSRHVHAVHDVWLQKLEILSARLGVSQKVTLLQSELVKVPVAIGYLKPVILIPFGMILQLPADQVETILLHELAHIRRKDYLVNLLQCALETIFFFNPGLLWLSSLLREEREMCCDDLVLAHGAGKVSYLEALLAFHQHERWIPGPVMALSLRKNQLANRLKRIINQENKRISAMEKIVLLSGMFMLSAFCYVTQNAESQPEKSVPLKFARVESESSALPKPASERRPAMNVDKKAAKPKQTIVPQPDPEVSRDTIYKFSSIRFERSNENMADREMTVRDENGNVYYLKVVANHLTEVKVNGVEVADSEIDKYQELFRQVDLAWNDARKNKEQLVAAERFKSEEERKQFLSAFKESWQNKHDQKNVNFAKTTTGFKKEKLAIDKSTTFKIEKDRNHFSTKKINDNEHITAMSGIKKRHEPRDISDDQARVRGIIAELVKARVIANQADLDWFGISEQELIVNDKKQSAELQQRLKQQYQITEGRGLFYGPVKMTGVGIFLDKDDI